MTFDLVFLNGNIITLEPDHPNCRWIAVKDGNIAALGERDDFSGKSEKVVDLKGHTLLPGFIDSHIHGSLTGQFLSAVNLRKVTCLEDIFSLIVQRKKEVGEGALIHCMGLNPSAIREKRMPTASELDAAAGENPCIVEHTSMHGLSVNTAALRLSEILEHPEVFAGEEENAKNGVFMRDSMADFVYQKILSKVDEDILRGYIYECQNFVITKGVTSIQTLNGFDYPKNGLLWEQEKDNLKIHAINFWETWDVKAAHELGLPRVGGCLFLDGARALWQAAYSKPFLNRPDTRGLLYHSDMEVYNFLYEAHKNGMQTGMHAMGDRAIDQVIYCLESVTKQLGDKGLRHRIEHFSCPTERHIEMAVEMQLALPMQPIWCDIWDNPNGSVLSAMLGDELAANNEPFAKIVKAGGMVCGSCDSPVTECDPIKGIHILINDRRDTRRVSVTDALKIWTYNCAWAGHEENIKGSLKVGKLADFVVIDQDPYGNAEHFDQTKVLMTVIAGNIVYQSSAPSA